MFGRAGGRGAGAVLAGGVAPLRAGCRPLQPARNGATPPARTAPAPRPPARPNIPPRPPSPPSPSAHRRRPALPAAQPGTAPDPAPRPAPPRTTPTPTRPSADRRHPTTWPRPARRPRTPSTTGTLDAPQASPPGRQHLQPPTHRPASPARWTASTSPVAAPTSADTSHSHSPPSPTHDAQDQHSLPSQQTCTKRATSSPDRHERHAEDLNSYLPIDKPDHALLVHPHQGIRNSLQHTLEPRRIRRHLLPPRAFPQNLKLSKRLPSQSPSVTAHVKDLVRVT